MDGSNNEWEGDRDRNEISGLYRKARRSKEPSNNGRGVGGWEGERRVMCRLRNCSQNLQRKEVRYES